MLVCMPPVGLLLTDSDRRSCPLGDITQHPVSEPGRCDQASPDALGLWLAQAGMSQKGLSPKKQYDGALWFVEKPEVRKGTESKLISFEVSPAQIMVRKPWKHQRLGPKGKSRGQQLQENAYSDREQGAKQVSPACLLRPKTSGQLPGVKGPHRSSDCTFLFPFFCSKGTGR